MNRGQEPLAASPSQHRTRNYINHIYGGAGAIAGEQNRELGTALVIVRQRNPVLQSQKMKERTETLAVGDQAPDFTLPAANREGTFSLSEWRQRGSLILEFLRGTW